ncbi:MAG: L-aspartate oxidase, partial [Terrabacter sp.]
STQATLAELAARAVTDDAEKQGGPKSWETTNLLHLGRALTYAAALREETRGGHVREDFPARDDEHFLHHVHLRRSASGTVEARVVPVPRSNLEGLDLDNKDAAENAVAQDDSRMEGRR